jgi:hypothetical protein
LSAACNSWANRANLSLIDMSCGGSDSIGIVDVCDTEADRLKMVYARELVKITSVLFSRLTIAVPCSSLRIVDHGSISEKL